MVGSLKIVNVYVCKYKGDVQVMESEYKMHYIHTHAYALIFAYK